MMFADPAKNAKRLASRAERRAPANPICASPHERESYSATRDFDDCD